MKTLVIAEKPSVGRDIAKVLKCNKKLNGAIEGNDYIVTWGLGHLVTLADPEKYDKRYKEWKMEYLPMMPKKLDTEVIKQTSKQFNAVKTLLNRNDVKSIVIATDAGREGELVARWILMKANNKKPCKRLWISSVTDKAIREGFTKLKDSKDYDNLFWAAVSRAEADWLVGINATRALTCKYNAQLSCGRVQTPTLSMIEKREEEIKNFVPQSFYGLSVNINNTIFTWKDEKSGSYRSFSRDRIDDINKKCRNESVNIINIDKKSKKSYSPLLYDLTELQRDANKRFGFSAKETLNIMQRLYENHKVLTYPRTDSRYITSDIVGTIKDRLKACNTGAYKKLISTIMNIQFSAKMSCVNNEKVSDHHAIIPTEQYPEFSHMTNEEKKIYDMVVRRFIAVLFPECEYEETILTSEICGEKFYAKGNVILRNGWKEVYDIKDEDEDEDSKDLRHQILPKFSTSQKIDNVVLTINEGKTKPPARFTEASLLSAMENPVKYMESHDKNMVKTLGETGGLGTVATRADIIEKLFSGFLIEKKENYIYITGKGKQLLELVPDDLKKPELTADWEGKFSKIAEGNLDNRKFMTDIRDYTEKLIEEIKRADGTFRHDNQTNKKCPQCGKHLLAVNGKNAKMLVCQDRECGYRETVSRISNARCPVCHKKMELVGKGENSMFVCNCGHKERLDKFQERRKKEGAGVSKKDISYYMKKQKSEPVNNAFADALKRLNKD